MLTFLAALSAERSDSLSSNSQTSVAASGTTADACLSVLLSLFALLSRTISLESCFR